MSTAVELAKQVLLDAGYEIRKQEGSLADFLCCVSDTMPGLRKRKYSEKEAEKRLSDVYKSPRQVVKSALSENAGITGGYAVPTGFTLRLMDVVAEENFILPRANVVPMDTATLLAPRIDVETAPSSSGIGGLLGGVVFRWGSEPTPGETEPTFRSLSLRAWDLIGYTVLSNQFLMDAGEDADEYIADLFGRAIGWYSEYAFLQGTGQDQLMPLGIINSTATIVVTRGGPGVIAQADIANMSAKMLPYSWRRAIWACSPSCIAQLIKIANFFINVEASDDGGHIGSLMTRPVFSTEKLASVGNSGDLLFFDPSLYVVGRRMDVMVDVSEHALFRNYQTVFRVWARLDGKPRLSKFVTLQDTSTTVSPYVMLQ